MLVSHQEAPAAQAQPRFVRGSNAPPFWDQRWDGWIIVGVAVLFRLIYLLQIRTNDPFYDHTSAGYDQDTYREQARDILAGDILLRGSGLFYYSPLYSYFSALIYWIGGFNNFDLLHGTHLLISSGSCTLTWRFARTYLTRAESFVAGLFAAFFAPWLFYEQLILLEVLVLFLNVMVLCLIRKSELVERRRPLNFFVAGAASALAYIGRGNFILVILALAIWIFVRFSLNEKSRERQWKRAAGCALLYSAGVILFLLPLGWRNHVVAGRWSFGTTNGPAMLYMGNSADSTGEFSYSPRFNEAQSKAKSDPQIYVRMLRTDIRQEPFSVLGNLARKTRYFWNSFDISDNSSLELGKAFSVALRCNPIGARFILTLGILGAFSSFRRRRAESLLWLYLIAFSVSIIIIIPVGRYRLPIFIVMIPFAARLVGTWVDAMRRRQFIRVGIWIAASLVIYFLIRPIPTQRAREIDYEGFVLASIRQARFKPAAQLLDWGLKDYPNNQILIMRQFWFFVETEAWEKAGEALPTILTFRARTYECYLAQVKLKIHDGESVVALKMLRSLLKSNPDHEPTKELLRQLESGNPAN